MVVFCQEMVNWPPRSCHLTPLSFFLWFTLSHWSVLTSQHCAEMCSRVVINCIQRIARYSCVRGGHINEVPFVNVLIALQADNKVYEKSQMVCV